MCKPFPNSGLNVEGLLSKLFCGWTRKKILIRSEIEQPDHVVVLDHTLIDVIDVTAGLAENGWILINTDLKPLDFTELAQFRVACVNASRIAADLGLGSRSAPIVNTGICGSFAQCTGLVKLQSVCDAIKEEAPIKAAENAQAATIAFNTTII